MNQNTVSGNLDRIKRATDDMRLITGTTGEDIETVAQAVSNLNDDNIAKDETIAELEQEIEDLRPSGTININNNGVTNVAGYQYADVNIGKFAPTSISFYNYAGNNTQLYNDMSSIDASNLVSMNYMFSNMPNITSIDTTVWNASNITTMINAFNGTRSSIDLRGIDVTNVTNLYQAFYGVYGDVWFPNMDFASVTTVEGLFGNGNKVRPHGMENWIMPNCTEFRWMFNFAGNDSSAPMPTIDLSNLIGGATNDVDVDMSYMFQYCAYTTTILIPKLVSNNKTTATNMFQGCTRLNHLDIRSFDFTVLTYYTDLLGKSNQKVPTNCLIIVKDDTQKQWLSDHFSGYSNIKTVAEYEGGNE